MPTFEESDIRLEMGLTGGARPFPSVAYLQKPGSRFFALDMQKTAVPCGNDRSVPVSATIPATGAMFWV
jgi:hypothetical protein